MFYKPKHLQVFVYYFVHKPLHTCGAIITMYCCINTYVQTIIIPFDWLWLPIDASLVY